MNFNSKYKIVDECKDIFDKCLLLVQLDSDIEKFKDEFFKQVGAVCIANMFKSLSQESQALATPALKANDLVQINLKFLSLFSEEKIAEFYVNSFKVLMGKMFGDEKYANVLERFNQLLSD